MSRSVLLLVLLLGWGRSLAADNVVVWDFATRDGQKNKTTNSFTNEFEEALSQKCTYTVLERRNLDRLQAVIQNEKALKDIGQITLGGSTELKRIGTSLIVFGEMFDDIDSGEITITVTFQDFKGKKVLIKSASMRRGLQRDSASRRKCMAALADRVCRSQKTTGPRLAPHVVNPAPSPTTLQPLRMLPSASSRSTPTDTRNRAITRKYDGLVYTLRRCSYSTSGHSLSCFLTVLSERAATTHLTINCAFNYTFVNSDDGTTTLADNCWLGSDKGSSFATAELTPGVEYRMGAFFDNITISNSNLSHLAFTVNDGRILRTLAFTNVSARIEP